MPSIKRFDHVGLTVSDLDEAIEFFTGLGMRVQGRMFQEGEFLDTVCGLTDARVEMAMLEPPGGGTCLELSEFLRPAHEPGSPDAPANTLGIRNVAFEVEDLRATLAEIEPKGYAVVGGVGEYESTWTMAYVRGPDGITVALAQRLD